ncbi:MAG: TolC family protein [Phycisphaerales bacterium]
MTSTPTSRHARALLLIAGLSLPLLVGCAGPLGERDSDLGDRSAIDRLRRVTPLSIDGFRRPSPAGTAAAAGSPGEPVDAATAATAVDPTIEQVRTRLASATRRELTIEQARAEAIRNNLDLRVSVMDPRIAREETTAERARFEAVFRPSARFTSTEPALLEDRTTGTSPRARTDSVELGAGVSIPLRTGGRASVDLTQDYREGNSPFSDTPAWGSSLAFSITQPLLRNAGREVNVAPITIAAYREQISEARTNLSVISTLAQIERSYWRLSAARKELDVRQQQYDLAMAQLQRAQRRFDRGDTPEIDVVRAQSGLAQRLEAIITAETSLLIEQRELNRLMNTPDASVTSGGLLVPLTEPAPMDYDLDSASLISVAMQRRMELLEIELSLLSDSLNITVARNNLLPGLDLTGTYTTAGLGRDLGRGIRDMADIRAQGYSVGVTGDIPLGNEAAEARERRAVLTRLQRLGTRASRRQLIEQDVLDAVDRVRSGWQRIMAARQSTILAARTLAGEQRQFDAGSRTSTDVLDAAAALADAQSAEIRALTDYQIALTDLAVATGTTLGSADIRWQEIPPADEQMLREPVPASMVAPAPPAPPAAPAPPEAPAP